MADINSLKQALAVSPDNVPLLLMLAEAYLDQFSLDEAKASYEAVLRVDPVNPYARTHLAQLLDLDGKSSEAILRLEQVCGDYPNFGPAWALRARFSLNENRAREAREFYEKAVALDPSMKNEELLKRIRQAGGQRSMEEPREPGPQRNGDRQSGAYY
nr:tetratricopeptide repeat protein [Verrucomicrobiales bacterium]